MKTDDEFHDLAPLSPRSDAQRWARLSGSIEAAAGPELARRAARQPNLLWGRLDTWARPALSTALAAAAAAALVLVSYDRSTPMAVDPGLSDALGFPGAIAAWVETGWTPSVEEILVTIQEDRP